MGENMMCPAHKAANQKSRDGWEATFGKKKVVWADIAEPGKDKTDIQIFDTKDKKFTITVRKK